MLMIEAHNQEAALGIHSYELGMNHLGDMVSTDKEAGLHYCQNHVCTHASAYIMWHQPITDLIRRGLYRHKVQLLSCIDYHSRRWRPHEALTERLAYQHCLYSLVLTSTCSAMLRIPPLFTSLSLASPAQSSLHILQVLKNHMLLLVIIT